MDESLSGLKLAVGAVLVVSILLLARSYLPTETTLQYEFKRWKQTEQQNLQSAARITADTATTPNEALPKDTAPPALPVLSLEVADLSTGKSQLYVFDARGDASRAPQLLRLLDLIEVSEIMSAAHKVPSKDDSQVVVLRVNAPGREFESRFSPQGVQGDMRALLLLRLLKEYAGEPREVPSTNVLAELKAPRSTGRALTQGIGPELYRTEPEIHGG